MDELNTKDDVFLVIVTSVHDPEREFITFVKGTNELAYFLIHYDKNLYEFRSAEEFYEGSSIYWNFKELLIPTNKGDQ